MPEEPPTMQGTMENTEALLTTCAALLDDEREHVSAEVTQSIQRRGSIPGVRVP